MQKITMNTPLFWSWATVVIIGNGPTSPRFWSPVSSTVGFQMGGIDTNGYGVNSTYTVGNGMAEYGNNGEKCMLWLRANGKKCFGGVLHNVFIVWS